MSEYIAKASIEPRDYRVVFLIQKAAASLQNFNGCSSFLPIFYTSFFSSSIIFCFLILLME